MKVVILPRDHISADKNVDNAMIRIGAEPIIYHTIQLFSKYGFNDFIIFDKSKRDDIKNYLISNSEKIKCMKFKIMKVNPLTKTSRMIELVRKMDDENAFFVAPYDVLIDLDLKKMLDYHYKNAKAVTVCVTEEKYPLKNADKSVEKKIETKIVNTGFYIFENEAIDYIRGNTPIDTYPIIRIAEDEELSMYFNEGFAKCCGV